MKLPGMWQERRLGDVCAGADSIRPSDLSRKTFRYVDISAVDTDRKAISPVEETRIQDAPGRARQLVRENDILVSTVRPGLNAVAMVPPTLDGEIASTGFCVLRADSSQLDPGYLFGYVQTPFFIRRLVRRQTGANYPAVRDADVFSLPIPLPPLSEQRRIVETLQLSDQVRDLRQQADEKAKGFIPALFYEMFGDPLANPKGWPTRPVSQIALEIVYGVSRAPNTAGRGVPLLRMNNVTTGGDLDLADLKHVELSETELQSQQLQPGDILFNRTNSRELVGKTGIWDGRFEAVAASYFIRLRLDERIMLPAVLWAFMNLPPMKARLFRMAKGAVGQANINSRELGLIQANAAALRSE